MLTVDELDRALRSIDPAADRSFDPESVSARRALSLATASPTGTVRRPKRRRLVLLAASGLATAGLVFQGLVLPTGNRIDVVAEAAEAASPDGVLHAVTEWRRNDQLMGTGELWFIPGDDPRSRFLNRRPDGRLLGETVTDAGGVSGWTASTNTIDRIDGEALGSAEEEALEALAAARTNDQRYVQLPDSTVRGIPVHVIRFQPPGRPATLYYLDEADYLPVRIAVAGHVIDVLRIDRLPLDQANDQVLRMGPHPDAEKRAIELED